MVEAPPHRFNSDRDGSPPLPVGLASPVVWLVDLVAGAEALADLGRRFDVMPAAVAEHSARRAEPEKYAARVALRALLAGLIGREQARLPFTLSEAGKPGLSDAATECPAARGLAFSLAHTDKYALIGLARGMSVGVDFETRRPIRVSSDRRALLERAAESLAPASPLTLAPPDDRFVHAWVRIEALAKATGEGVSALLGRLGARGRFELPDRMGAAATAPDVVVWDLELPDGVSAFAALAAVGAAATSISGPPELRVMPLDTDWLEALVDHPAG